VPGALVRPRRAKRTGSPTLFQDFRQTPEKVIPGGELSFTGFTPKEATNQNHHSCPHHVVVEPGDICGEGNDEDRGHTRQEPHRCPGTRGPRYKESQEKHTQERSVEEGPYLVHGFDEGPQLPGVKGHPECEHPPKKSGQPGDLQVVGIGGVGPEEPPVEIHDRGAGQM